MKILIPFIALLTLAYFCVPSNAFTTIENSKAIKMHQTDTMHHVLYQSFDKGKTWMPMPSDLPNGTQVSFMEKLGNEILLATDNKGLFISDKNKTNWKQIGKSLPYPKITALHISENTIFVSLYERGVFISKNKGQTWTSINYNLPELKVQSILKNKSTLLVGADTGIYELDPIKKIWSKIFDGGQVVYLKKYNEKILAGTQLGVVESNNFGQHWNWVHQNGAIHNIAILNENIVAMYVSGDLSLSYDKGESWNNVFYTPNGGTYVYESDYIDQFFIMSTNYGIHRSANWGITWDLVKPTEDMAFFDFLIMDEVIYAGTRHWNEYRK